MLSTNRYLAVVLTLAVCPSLAAAAVEVKELPDKVRIEIDGKLFTEYVHTGTPHVYYWPVIGPGGVKMTRAWPMAEAPNEERDHPHHRSLWFSHGAVNGIDFWAEAPPAGPKPPKQPIGRIMHSKVLEAKGGPEQGVLKTAQNWIASDGSVPLTSTQTLRVYDRPENERLFDFIVTLTAGQSEVVLGDTKEGTAAIRVAESMRLKQPKGKTAEGSMVNSNGDKDGAVWGKKAAWVTMTGPVDGRKLGIAFFDHPKNPRHPTRWHARDYGLFAANPFCEVDMDKAQPKGAGDYRLKPGETVTLKYRLYFYEGDPEQAKVAERFKEFTAENP